MRLTRQAIINIVLAVVIVAALVVVAIVFWPRGQGSSSAASRLTSTVQQGTVSSTISASGSISPVSESDPAFKVSGTVKEVYVSLGDTVKKGQKLAKLSTSSYQQAVTDAYTDYVHASQNLTATEKQKGVQLSQVNSAKEQVTQAWEQYQSAQADLSHTTLTSPISGVVTAVNVAVGDSSGGTGSSGSSGSSGAFAIANVSKYVMTANIAEADIAQVTVGQDATITFPALDNATATAKVTAIAPTATSSNSVVTYATTITLTSTPDNLRLGQTADAAIVISSSAADALYVPAAAITTASDGTKTVEVVGADGTEQAVTVETGVVGDNGTEITSGLTAGETIVIGTLSASTTTGTGTTTTRGGFGGFGGTTGGFGGTTGGFGGTGTRTGTGSGN